jgi:hypothetical protein
MFLAMLVLVNARQYNKYMFKLINIYSFITVSGCAGMDPSALLYQGVYTVVKTVLLHIARRMCYDHIDTYLVLLYNGDNCIILLALLTSISVLLSQIVV